MDENKKEQLINRYEEMVKYINEFKPYDAISKFIKNNFEVFILYLNGENFDIFSNINQKKVTNRKYRSKIYPQLLEQIKHLMNENYDIEDIASLVSLSKNTIYKNITRIMKREELENYFKRRKQIKKDYVKWCKRKKYNI